MSIKFIEQKYPSGFQFEFFRVGYWLAGVELQITKSSNKYGFAISLICSFGWFSFSIGYLYKFY